LSREVNNLSNAQRAPRADRKRSTNCLRRCLKTDEACAAFRTVQKSVSDGWSSMSNQTCCVKIFTDKFVHNFVLSLKIFFSNRLVFDEMRMLRWILGLTSRDTKRNDNIRRILGVACITDKSTKGQVEMVWACTTPRRGELCQENLGGRCMWTTE